MFLSSLVRIILNKFDYFQQKKILKFLKSKLNDNITVIDVGAHHGETISLFNKNFDIKELHAFEASPLNFKILMKKYNKKKYENKITLNNFALGESEYESFINQTIEISSSTINDINENSNYFKRKKKILTFFVNKKFSIQVPINIITLDKYLESKNINHIDLIKIDTEGYEFMVLKGLFKNFINVDIVYFEHHYDNMIKKGYKFADINNLLLKNNFKKVYKSKMIFRKSFEYIYIKK